MNFVSHCGLLLFKPIPHSLSRNYGPWIYGCVWFTTFLLEARLHLLLTFNTVSCISVT